MNLLSEFFDVLVPAISFLVLSTAAAELLAKIVSQACLPDVRQPKNAPAL